MRPIRLYFSPEPGYSSSQGCSRLGFPLDALRISIRWRLCVVNDLKFACRQLLKNPGFTAVAVLTLALGIGANTAIFSIVNAVLLKALPYREQENLLTLWERNPQRGVEQEFVTPPNYADWREQSRVFEQMAYWNGVQQLNLVATDGVEKARRAHVESSFFSVLRVAPLLGRTFLHEEDKPQGKPVAVLIHDLWERRLR